MKKKLNNPFEHFQVDSDCISCDMCEGIAPLHFKIIQDKQCAAVIKQPQTPSEFKVCEDAFTCCPVGAIQKSSLCQ
ncbi:MAG: ferredoxin [Candidatus Margulisbacteria bacterium]|nr:ferredoxin [Candidatus Margulisiibacteriota bacterium]